MIWIDMTDIYTENGEHIFAKRCQNKSNTHFFRSCNHVPHERIRIRGILKWMVADWRYDLWGAQAGALVGVVGALYWRHPISINKPLKCYLFTYGHGHAVGAWCSAGGPHWNEVDFHHPTLLACILLISMDQLSNNMIYFLQCPTLFRSLWKKSGATDLAPQTETVSCHLKISRSTGNETEVVVPHQYVG